MQLNILKTKRVLCVFLVITLISSCTKKTAFESQITIKIKSIDSDTGQPRINKFDTIEVRVAEFGIPMRKYVKVAEYITDYEGSVITKLDRNKEYHFILRGPYIYGATEFSEQELKNNQEVNIEVIPIGVPSSLKSK